jgi:hypothetical protein
MLSKLAAQTNIRSIATGSLQQGRRSARVSLKELRASSERQTSAAGSSATLPFAGPTNLGQVPDITVHDDPEVALLVVRLDLGHRDQVGSSHRPPRARAARGFIELNRRQPAVVDVECEGKGRRRRRQDLPTRRRQTQDQPQPMRWVGFD